MRAIDAFLSALTTGVLVSGTVLPAIAQVTSDGTTNTIVNPNNNNFSILNGIERGNNLFHSFSNFSVPNGGSASFDLVNTPNITTIFSRVTGGNVSDINGLIETLNGNNPVSLFLMNPQGIVFGENASLNIGGSFVGTTANSIKFVDGTEFSVVNPTNSPLLTMSVPVGLQMGSNPGAITVQGTGHQFKSSFLTGIDRGSSTDGLRVQPGKTLALIGGDINLNGGTLTAEGGRVELGSIEGIGLVGVNSNPQGFAVDYSGISNFGNIQLIQEALIDVSSSRAGAIQVQAQQLDITDGSLIVSQNDRQGTGGSIRINATEAINITGYSQTADLISGIYSDTLGSGTSGDINLSTAGLTIQNGGTILNRTYSDGNAGNINIQASEFVQVRDSKLPAYSLISTPANSSGRGGDINITTNWLLVANGAQLTAVAQNTGQGGDLTINADRVEVIGNDDVLPTALSASSLTSGSSGNLLLNTRTLSVRDSGVITSSGIGSGNAGDITINASESVEVTGNVPGANSPSEIRSAITVPSAFAQQVLNLPAVPRGKGGNLTINTPTLTVNNEGAITVRNQGVGDAGEIEVNTDTIRLDNGGTISATTNFGEGGNLFLTTNTLTLRRGSSIVTTAGGTGNGGNITINSPIIAGLEDSDIIANAFQGNGGNINITTQGIFGLEFRDQLTDESDITASSQFGVSGTVDINNFGVDPSSGLVELPIALADSSQEIASSCSQIAGSSFVVTGRGGMRQNPTEKVIASRPWSDIRDLSAFRQQKVDVAQVTQVSQEPEIVEATGWVRNAKGEIELVAQAPGSLPPQATCSATSI